MSRATEDSQDRHGDAVAREVARVAHELGIEVHAERTRRRLSLEEVARQAGLSQTRVHDIECGLVGSLETYVGLSRALRLRTEFGLVDPRRRDAAPRQQDPVHAAMVEVLAAHFQELGYPVAIDDPYQHYQFAGRGDFDAVCVERLAFLHSECNTALPDLEDAAGSFNAKRLYLGAEVARRHGIERWRSETHVLVGLWSAEILHSVRIHRASMAALCPDDPFAFEAWWAGEPPATGRRSILLLLDPLEGRRSDRARWVSGEALETVRPRYRDYRDALDALKRAGRA